MSIQHDPSGRRSIQVETEVPGTPEEVWEAIASGPGISAWFVPTRFENGPDGTPREVVMTFGPGMDGVARVTAWEPHRRFAAESDDLGPGAPTMATEWSVEAKDGGICVVRVVHSLFTESDDWDDQLRGMETGWPAFFLILRLYLGRFRGEPSKSFSAVAMSSEPLARVWSTFAGGLGLAAASPGARWRTPGDAPLLGGVIDQVNEGEHPHRLVLLDEPAPGVAMLSVCGTSAGGPVMATASVYLYGPEAAATAATAEPAWQAWLAAKFPPAVESATAASS